MKLDLETPVIKTFPRTYAPAPPPPPPQPIGSPRKPSPGRAADRNVDSLIQELGDKARDPTRTYQELLDVYSLHEFIIRKGKTLANTPEFMSFQRSFRDGWDGIKAVVVALEELLTEYAIPLAYIDGKKVAVLGGVLRRQGLPQGRIRGEGISKAAPEAVRQAVGGGCQSGWGRLLSVTNAIEAGTCR